MKQQQISLSHTHTSEHTHTHTYAHPHHTQEQEETCTCKTATRHKGRTFHMTRLMAAGPLILTSRSIILCRHTYSHFSQLSNNLPRVKAMTNVWVAYIGDVIRQGWIQVFSKRVTFVKGGTINCLITKICELGACFLYFSYVLAQNGGVTSYPFHPPGSALAYGAARLVVASFWSVWFK